MTASIAYVTQFGSKVLHNGSTIHCTDMLTKSGKAKLNLVTLPSGAIIDPNGSSEDAAVVPQKFKSVHLLTYTSEATAVAEAESILALVGTRDTVTATKVSSGTDTCEARIEQVTIVNKRKKTKGFWKIMLEISFQPITAFS